MSVKQPYPLIERTSAKLMELYPDISPEGAYAAGVAMIAKTGIQLIRDHDFNDKQRIHGLDILMQRGLEIMKEEEAKRKFKKSFIKASEGQ